MKADFLLATVLILSLAGLNMACEPPDCDRNDCGTCSNACCTLDFFFRANTLELSTTLGNLLKSKGPDNLYSFSATDDLRQYNISAHFLIQGIHTTLVKRYNDTLDFAVYPLPAGRSIYQSRLRAFSISQIHGAYCDNGQNYKNLVYLVKNLKFKDNTGYIENHVAGCLPPNTP